MGRSRSFKLLESLQMGSRCVSYVEHCLYDIIVLINSTVREEAKDDEDENNKENEVNCCSSTCSFVDALWLGTVILVVVINL